MATFICHGLIGAAGMGIVTGGNPLVMSCGFIAGTIPDSADWVARKIFKRTGLNLYSRMHNGDLTWLGLLLPPFCWHVLFDLPFHDPPVENWWPRLWYAEVLADLISTATIIKMIL